jgi:hypothetical protein
MKINQIVSEHKKGVKARVYNKKGPEARKVAKQPAQPGVATAFAGQVAKEDATQQVYKVTKSDPNTGLTLSKPDGTQLILPPDKMNAIAANPNDPNKYLLNPDAIAQQATSGQPSGPEIGREVEVNTAENPDQAFGEELDDAVDPQPGDVGGDATDAYIDSITDHDFEQAQGRLRELAGFGVTQHNNGDTSYNQGPLSMRQNKDGSSDMTATLGDTTARVQQNPIGVKTMTAQGPAADALIGAGASAQRKGVDPAKFARFQQQNPAANESADDKLLQKMLTIAGLR